MLFHVEGGEKIVMCMCNRMGEGGRAQWVNAGGRAVLLLFLL